MNKIKYIMHAHDSQRDCVVCEVKALCVLKAILVTIASKNILKKNIMQAPSNDKGDSIVLYVIKRVDHSLHS